MTPKNSRLITLRIPFWLYEIIKAHAEKEQRGVSAQIRKILIETYEGEKNDK